jgi:hypothetical protein
MVSLFVALRRPRLGTMMPMRRGRPHHQAWEERRHGCSEAVSRPNMRFVPVKSADQQAVLMPHRTRALLIRQQTMLANAFRTHLAEFGAVVAQGIRHVRELIEKVFGEGAPAIYLPALACTALRPLVAQLTELRLQIKIPAPILANRFARPLMVTKPSASMVTISPAEAFRGLPQRVYARETMVEVEVRLWRPLPGARSRSAPSQPFRCSAMSKADAGQNWAR